MIAKDDTKDESQGCKYSNHDSNGGMVPCGRRSFCYIFSLSSSVQTLWSCNRIDFLVFMKTTQAKIKIMTKITANKIPAVVPWWLPDGKQQHEGIIEIKQEDSKRVKMKCFELQYLTFMLDDLKIFGPGTLRVSCCAVVSPWKFNRQGPVGSSRIFHLDQHLPAVSGHWVSCSIAI